MNMKLWTIAKNAMLNWNKKVADLHHYFIYLVPSKSRMEKWKKVTKKQYHPECNNAHKHTKVKKSAKIRANKLKMKEILRRMVHEWFTTPYKWRVLNTTKVQLAVFTSSFFFAHCVYAFVCCNWKKCADVC